MQNLFVSSCLFLFTKNDSKITPSPYSLKNKNRESKMKIKNWICFLQQILYNNLRSSKYFFASLLFRNCRNKSNHNLPQTKYFGFVFVWPRLKNNKITRQEIQIPNSKMNSFYGDYWFLVIWNLLCPLLLLNMRWTWLMVIQNQYRIFAANFIW